MIIKFMIIINNKIWLNILIPLKRDKQLMINIIIM